MRKSGCLDFKDMCHLVKAKVVDGGECEGELHHFLGEIQITKLEICSQSQRTLGMVHKLHKHFQGSQETPPPI